MPENKAQRRLTWTDLASVRGRTAQDQADFDAARYAALAAFGAATEPAQAAHRAAEAAAKETYNAAEAAGWAAYKAATVAEWAAYNAAADEWQARHVVTAAGSAHPSKKGSA